MPKENAAKLFWGRIQLVQTFSLLYFEKGNAELSLNQYEKAINSFQYTVTLLPTFTEAAAYLEFSKNALVQSKVQSKNTEVDSQQIQPVDADLAKQSLNSLIDNGLILEKLNLKKLALNHFEEAVKRFPDSVKAQTRLGILHKDEKRFTESLIHLNAAIKLNPNKNMPSVNPIK